MKCPMKKITSVGITLLLEWLNIESLTYHKIKSAIIFDAHNGTKCAEVE